MDEESADGPETGEIVAFWVKGASDEQRDAHHRAERWAHVLSWQIDRLYASRTAAMEMQDQVRSAGHYPDEARWPFFEMESDAHFALVAARQLVRALRAFDGDDRLPEGLTSAQVRDVRDALEHWDEPAGRAATNLKRQGATASSHRWSHAGPGLLGDLISDAVLREWAVEVYCQLKRWDPYKGWPR